jgi:ABC-type antimicrobial peptide transport system permease subunit
MKLPLKYNLRSLVQRPLRSLLTLIGVGIAVFLSVMMLGLSRGLVASTVATGEPLNVLVLSKGAESMEFSALDPEALHVLGTAQGIRQVDGVAQVSPEVLINTVVAGGQRHDKWTPVLVRGVREEIGLALHPQVAIAEGRAPERGFEVAIGPLVATRLGLPESALGLGSTLEFEGASWEVVGKLSAPGTAFEAEIWTQLDDLMAASKRDDYSALVLGAADAASRDDLLFDLQTRTDVRSTVHVESEYYAAGVQQMKPVQAVASIMALLLIAGGLLAGMNTMFNSIMGRTREMAVLQVLGYKRRAILTSFVLEGVALCLAGGAIGCVAGMALNGLPMKFSMGAFRFLIDMLTILAGLGVATAIGLFGSMVPVLRVARLKTTEALRMQA